MASDVLSEDVEKISIETIGKVVTGIFSFVALLYTIAKFFTQPFLNSPESAKIFMSRTSDPMQKIKDHFKGLIKNLNGFNYNVAIFIDDLDRCNADFTVRLLEGIQTLFKDKGVLLIIPVKVSQCAVVK